MHDSGEDGEGTGEIDSSMAMAGGNITRSGVLGSVELCEGKGELQPTCAYPWTG